MTFTKHMALVALAALTTVVTSGCGFYLAYTPMSRRLEEGMRRAPVAPSPAKSGDLGRLPAVRATSDGGLVRLIAWSDDHTCFNGEVPVAPEILEKRTFRLESYHDRDQDPEQATKDVTKNVKLLGSYAVSSTRGMTQLQICFEGRSVLDESTSYLVLTDGAWMLAIWHFDEIVASEV